MANQPNQRQRLLAVLKILMEKTDRNNPMNTLDLIGELAGEYDIDAERKAIQRDIRTLTEMGFTVSEAKRGCYYYDARPFEDRELRMLVDAVQSSPCLSENTTDALIGKLQSLTAEPARPLLTRRIGVPSRVKMAAKTTVLENLDIIQEAMRRNMQITFKYTEYNDNRESTEKHGGRWYTYTPVRLVYSNEFYYLFVYNPDYKNKGFEFSPYRVDRMEKLRVADKEALADSDVRNYNPAEHESPSFGVYAAPMSSITLEFDEVPERRWPKEGYGTSGGRRMPSPMNAIVDKFGTDLKFTRHDGKVRVHAKALLSPQFFGWLMELDPAFGVRLVFPREAVEMYKKRLRDTLAMYE